MYNLVSTITDLPKLIGCSDFPNTPQGMQLIKLINDFVNNEYQYNGAQVKEAFTMAVKRELYLDGRRVDPSTFGQHLSVNVVGQVLTAYKEHKRTSNARPMGYNYNQLPERQIKNITPFEAYELCAKWYRNEGELINAPVNMAYDYLLSNGLVKKVEEVKTNRFQDNFDGTKYRAVEFYLSKNVV